MKAPMVSVLLAVQVYNTIVNKKRNTLQAKNPFNLWSFGMNFRSSIEIVANVNTWSVKFWNIFTKLYFITVTYLGG